MSSYDFVAGDTNSKLAVTFLKKGTKTAVDITGASVKLYFSNNGGAKQQRTMTITDGPNGKAEYLFQAGELVAGSLVVESEVTSSGKVLTSLEATPYLVRPRLP